MSDTGAEQQSPNASAPLPETDVIPLPSTAEPLPDLDDRVGAEVKETSASPEHEIAAEDLPDNVASNVRAVAADAEPAEYEALDNGEDSMAAAGAAGLGVLPSRSTGNALSPATSRETEADATATVERRPAQGIQLDAAVDLLPPPGFQSMVAPSSTSLLSDQTPVSGAAGTNAMPDAATDRTGASTTTALELKGKGVPLKAKSVPPPPGNGAAPQQHQLDPQPPSATVDVTVTILPMEATTILTVPVYPHHRHNHPPSATDGKGGVGNDGGETWVLVAKELFEAIGDRLSVHPQSFYIFHNQQRIRFMGTIFIDRDPSSANQLHNLNTNAEGGTTATAVAPQEKAAPIWVSIVFPLPGGDAMTEAEATSATVPSHLAILVRDDYVSRCLCVNRRKIVIPPRTLVEGRRQGYTYDEVIRHIEAQQLALEAATAATAAADAASAQHRRMIVSVLQDAPTLPRKLFLGGFRDKRNPNRILHNASTQLFMKDLNYSPFAQCGATSTIPLPYVSRQTQTMGISRSCQTRREACVQSPRLDLSLDNSRDYQVVARPYFSAADLAALQWEMSILIQKMYRQWKARRVRRALEAADSDRRYRAGERQRREEALLMAVADAAQMRRDDPRTARDFEQVKAEIAAWQAEEVAQIHSDESLSPAEVREAILAITKKGLQLLQQLEQRRREVARQRRADEVLKNLTSMSSAKKWGEVEVHTPETLRALELRHLYCSLIGLDRADEDEEEATAETAAETGGLASSIGKSSTATRLDTLLRVKWTVREFSDNEISQELCQLIDREADLLHRGRKDASLSGLRQRIRILFTKFVLDPSFNPGAADFAVNTALGRSKLNAMKTTTSAMTSTRGKGVGGTMKSASGTVQSKH